MNKTQAERLEIFKTLKWEDNELKQVVLYLINQIPVVEKKRIGHIWKSYLLSLKELGASKADVENIYAVLGMKTQAVREQRISKLQQRINANKKSKPKTRQTETLNTAKKKDPWTTDCPDCDKKDVEITLDENLKEQILKLPEDDQDKVIDQILKKKNIELHPRVKKRETKIEKILEAIA